MQKRNEGMTVLACLLAVLLNLPDMEKGSAAVAAEPLVFNKAPWTGSPAVWGSGDFQKFRREYPVPGFCLRP